MAKKNTLGCGTAIIGLIGLAMAAKYWYVLVAIGFVALAISYVISSILRLLLRARCSRSCFFQLFLLAARSKGYGQVCDQQWPDAQGNEFELYLNQLDLQFLAVKEI